MRHFWLSSVIIAALASPAYAQSVQGVEVGQLGEAAQYDAPIVRGGGRLDAALWQGTSAKTAASLISDAPIMSGQAIVADLVKAAIFSGGVPPEGPEAGVQAYRAARLTAATALGQDKAAEGFVKNDYALAADPGVNADIALAAGNTTEACHIADGVSEGRGTPRWVRLRAFCHVLRDEAAAAELSTELLQSSGYEDPLYFDLMDVLTKRKRSIKVTDLGIDPLYAAMAGTANIKLATDKMPPSMAASLALSENTGPQDRLDALYRAAPALSDTQIGTILQALAAVNAADGEAKSFDYQSALKAPVPAGTGQLYALLRSASGEQKKAMALAELLRRAEQGGAFTRLAKFYETDIVQLDSRTQAKFGAKIFASVAVDRGDIGALQGLHQNLNGKEAAQNRVALASDSLGNGFIMGPLGNDIDTRLGDAAKRTRAVRDAVIALAMGAQISDTAAGVLSQTNKGVGRSVKAGELLTLEAVARRGSRAETALRAAKILDAGGPASLDNDSLNRVIAALNKAGLSDFAGRVAAEDFLSGLTE